MSDFQKQTLKRYGRDFLIVWLRSAGVWYDKICTGVIRNGCDYGTDYCRRVYMVYGGLCSLGLAVAW